MQLILTMILLLTREGGRRAFARCTLKDPSSASCSTKNEKLSFSYVSAAEVVEEDLSSPELEVAANSQIKQRGGKTKQKETQTKTEEKIGMEVSISQVTNQIFITILFGVLVTIVICLFFIFSATKEESSLPIYRSLVILTGECSYTLLVYLSLYVMMLTFKCLLFCPCK